MKTPGLTVALLLAASYAGAELAVYDAGPDNPGVFFSGDGYHYAFLESSGGEDRWIVDGRVRAKAPKGELAGPGALSANGSVLLHLIAVFDEAGRKLGGAAAVNGRRMGGVYEDIQDLMLSPRGTNAAYAAKTPRGWAVISRQGTGPAFKEPPLHLAVTETQTAYFAGYGGAVWLYRDHKPVMKTPYLGASTSRDLRRTGGVYKAADGDIYVDVDGKTFGPFNSASAPAFSDNGMHSAFLAASQSENSYDTLIVDGRPAPMRRCGDCSVSVDDRGRVFQDVIMVGVTPRTQIHAAFKDGKSLHAGGQPPRIGLAPGGKHYVYPMLATQGVAVGLDGKLVERGAPMPLVPAPTVFDGEEYHYWSEAAGKLYLVCGSAEGPRAPKPRCAGVARSLGWKAAEVIPEPASR